MKKILFLTLIGILICSSAYALNLSRVKTWNASDVLTASDLNAEFDNIVNHAIVNADVSASAAIVASKLDLTVASAIGSTTASTGAFTTLTASGATTLNGDNTIGNATGDALTFHPSAWTLTNAVTITGTWTNLGTVTTATINGGTITGITDLAVADGGTGASTLTDGGVLLGSGTGAITPMAVLADGEMIVGDGTTDPVAESGATLRTSIGVAIGTDVQAYDAQLADLADGSLSGAGTCDTSALTGTTYLPDGTVDTTALKTATSEVSTTSTTPGGGNLVVTGGSYCFYPQIKTSTTNQLRTYISYDYSTTTYATIVDISMDSGTGYAQFRYVTASGEDYWLFILIDKTTKDILSMSGGNDAPAYGNSNDFEKQPHPFTSYDINTQDIILIEKSQAKEIQVKAKEKGLSVLELVDRDYKIDFSQTYPYEPIHSGQFSPDKKPVLVENIPNYIQVRKLVLMTDDDKLAKEQRRLDKQAVFEAEKILKENKKQTILEKLKITRDELELILK